ncbi:MAG TPA: hypothetical protein VFI28_01965 [Candidatus Limnocylindrales bacterium]|nr:hypothetical protein [Candidatus Limnocylindrales bacterium]
MTDTDDPSIDSLAAAWLELERRSASDPTFSIEPAREASYRFEAAILGATQEELRLAWEAARQTQAGNEIGSEEWVHARSVSELLRVEYEASRADGRE